MLPLFLQLAGDPVRWELLRELANSDRRVRELVAAVEKPQNQVSYHLRQLRDAGLVTSRRSSFDARDTYYHLDVSRCVEMWAEAGTALGILNRPTVVRPYSRVLFLCTGNSGRSPLAAALLRLRAGERVAVTSAGSHPKPLHPDAVRVAAEYGIELKHEPTHLDTVRRKRFDLVISLCDVVREVLPAFPGPPRLIHWSIADPAGEPDTRPAFRRTAAELDSRIRDLGVLT